MTSSYHKVLTTKLGVRIITPKHFPKSMQPTESAIDKAMRSHFGIKESMTPAHWNQVALKHGNNVHLARNPEGVWWVEELYFTH